MTVKSILLRDLVYCARGLSLTIGLMLLALFGVFWCKQIYDCAYGLATAGWVGLLDALWKYVGRPIPQDGPPGAWAFGPPPSWGVISLRYLLMLAITYGLWRFNRHMFRFLLRDKPKTN